MDWMRASGRRQRTQSRPGGKSAKTRRTVLLRVEKAKLEGVALTFQTGRGMHLRPPKFRLLTEVSPDGVRFPGTPEAFHEELLR